MTAFLSWYFLITLLGWLTFPLIYRLFPALTDRGYTLARAAGLLVWGYAFWLLASLGLAQNDIGGVLLGLLVPLALSAWAISNLQSPLSTLHFPIRRAAKSPEGELVEASNPHSPLSNLQSPIVNRNSEIVDWLRSNLRLVIITELIFLLAFAFMALVRAANPEILGTEKPMELMFINAILRSPAFPPQDAWLSGYAISYYYFGYVMTVILARLTAVPGTLAFNLMISLIFALAAIGAYGILYNLLNSRKLDDGPPTTNHRPSSMVHGLPLLGPLFFLLVSNIEGFLEMLHRRGIFWSRTPSGDYVSGFWTWLGVKDLNQPPPDPLIWVPERHWWWWRASRVVQDFDLLNNPQEVIDEFPFFSFLLGDLHPHVLAIPFTLLAVAVAFNLYSGGWRGEIDLFGARLHVNPEGFVTIALVLGGLAFLNTWDILIAAALIVLAYALARVRTDGWSWSRFEDLFLFGLPAGLAAIILYLPFYFSFSSQAGGFLPNLINPTRGAHLWLMYSSLLLPLFAYLAYQAARSRPRWRLALALCGGLALILWLASWALALLANWRDPVFVLQYLQSQGGLNAALFFSEATLIRLSSIGGLLTLLALLCPALALLLSTANDHTSINFEEQSPIPNYQLPITNPSSTPFVLLLIVLGALLVLAPEFIYLRDQFGSRMNTVFKFYYQAWMLWSLAAAFAVAVLLRNSRGLADWLFRIFLVILLFTALTYPVLSLTTKTSQFQPASGFTLDDFDRVQRETPDEAAAIAYLRAAPYGVLAEAASIGGSYTNYGRISTYTGLPAVLGWPGHESQWRGGHEPQGTRLADLETLYTTSSREAAQQIIDRYQIRYVVVGGLERTSYPVQEGKFITFLRVAFQQGDITIYEVPREQ